MTDRELLELAAKAAGIEHVTPMMLEWGKWNPLEDDGDALRLAVKLRLDVTFGFDDEENVVSVNANWDGAPAEVIQEIIGQDVSEATRRAIVRAAAEIGREME